MRTRPRFQSDAQNQVAARLLNGIIQNLSLLRLLRVRRLDVRQQTLRHGPERRLLRLLALFDRLRQRGVELRLRNISKEGTPLRIPSADFLASLRNRVVYLLLARRQRSVRNRLRPRRSEDIDVRALPRRVRRTLERQIAVRRAAGNAAKRRKQGLVLDRLVLVVQEVLVGLDFLLAHAPQGNDRDEIARQRSILPVGAKAKREARGTRHERDHRLEMVDQLLGRLDFNDDRHLVPQVGRTQLAPLHVVLVRHARPDREPLRHGVNLLRRSRHQHRRHQQRQRRHHSFRCHPVLLSLRHSQNA